MASPASYSCILSCVSFTNYIPGLPCSSSEHFGGDLRKWRRSVPARETYKLHAVSTVSGPVTEASPLEDTSQTEGKNAGGKRSSRARKVSKVDDALPKTVNLDWVKQEGVDFTNEAAFLKEKMPRSKLLSLGQGVAVFGNVIALIRKNRRYAILNCGRLEFQRTIWRVNRTISRCSSVGEALNVIEEMKAAGLRTVNEGTYLALITVCRRQRQGERAISILEAMKQAGVKPGMLTYNTLISCCQQSLRLEDAFRIKEEMEVEGEKPDVVTYTSLIALTVKANPVRGRTSPEQRFQKAMQLYNEMVDRSIQPDVIAFNTLMYAASQASLPGKVLDVYRSMGKAGVIPNQFTFATLFEAVGAGGRLKSALEVFNEMKASGLAPQTSTYNFLIEACATAPQPNANKAWEFFDEMKKVENLTPDAVTYSQLIAASCKGGDHAAALKAYELMKEAGFSSAVTTSIYNTLIHSASMTSGLELAFELYERMRREGYKPDVVTNSTLLSACARADDLPRALAVSEEFKKLGISPNQVVLHSLIGAFGNAGRLEDAISTFRSMEDTEEPPTAVSYSIVFNACFGKDGVDGILSPRTSQDGLEITMGIRVAMGLYREAVATGIFKNFSAEDLSRCDVRKNGRSATVVALLVWLSDVKKAPPSKDLVIVVGTSKGKEVGKAKKSRLPWKYGVVEGVLKALGLPNEKMSTLTLQALTVKSSALETWLSNSGATYFPSA